MKKLFFIASIVLGIMSMANAKTSNGGEKNKADKPTKVVECRLTVTCADGTTVTATASSCEKAGKMVDAGCSS